MLVLLINACDPGGTDHEPRRMEPDSEAHESVPDSARSDSAGVDTGALDEDWDGYDASQDCNDRNPAVHPEAEEMCNNRDDDCDAEVDEGLEAVPAYTDFDGDGFGDAATPVVECDIWEGTAADGTDCDDTAASVHPGADETCNRVDDDCDGSVDEDAVDPVELYADADGDGSGVGEPVGRGCPSDGFSASGDDCDDADATVFPEVCRDGVDSHCEGDVSVTCALVSMRVADGDVLIAGDWVGVEVFGAGDLDGDGCDEFLTKGVGSYGYVFGDCALPALSDSSIVQATLTTTGHTFGPGGDLDGDGYADVAVGNAGVLIFAGPLSGTLPDGDATYELTQATDEPGSERAGSAHAYAGDTNGDGIGDFVVGAYARNSSRGRAYVVEGPVSSMSLTDAEGVYEGATVGEAAGFAVARAGDTDADGYDDVLIAAPWDGGVVYLLRGPVDGSGSLADADASIGAEEAGAGALLAAGDVDGDGRSDALVYASGATNSLGGPGVVYVVRGPMAGATGFADAATPILPSASDSAVTGLATSDVDADGADEILISTDWALDGRTWLFEEPPSTSVSTADAGVAYYGSTDSYARYVAGPGDVNGDGYGDILIGAPYEYIDGNDGAAVVVYGTGP